MKTMNVFSLREEVVREYRNFATSFTTIIVEGLVRAFLPRRRFPPQLEAGASLPVYFQQLDNFLDSPVVLLVQTHAGLPAISLARRSRT